MNVIRSEAEVNWSSSATSIDFSVSNTTCIENSFGVTETYDLSSAVNVRQTIVKVNAVIVKVTFIFCFPLLHENLALLVPQLQQFVSEAVFSFVHFIDQYWDSYHQQGGILKTINQLVSHSSCCPIAFNHCNSMQLLWFQLSSTFSNYFRTTM